MNAITYYSEAIKKVDEGEITIGEYERMINVLRDVEPVVRCRDCKHNQLPSTCGNANCEIFYGMTDQDGFCHMAERRTDDQGCRRTGRGVY